MRISCGLLCTVCVCVVSTHVFWSFEKRKGMRTYVGMGGESILKAAGEALPGLGGREAREGLGPQRPPRPTRCRERRGLSQGGRESWSEAPRLGEAKRGVLMGQYLAHHIPIHAGWPK